MRIVQVVNLVHPTSGGIRTVLRRLADGYAAAGHEVVLVAPGARGQEPWDRSSGPVRLLPGVPVPGGAGYRMMVRRGPLAATLAELAPDAVELSDRWTLGWVGRWARARGVPTTLLVHERLDHTVASWLPGPHAAAAAVARRLDRRVTADHVVAPSGFVASSVQGLGPVQRVPWGVDAGRFSPAAGAPPAGRPGRDRPVRLVWTGRLSAEKRPGRAVETLAALLARGVPAELTLLGDGPLRPRLAADVHGLPVRLAGHLRGSAAVAAELATADVALSTCRIEAFGLAALESLACGTPVVTVAGGGVPELLADATAGPAPGAVVDDDPDALAAGVLDTLARPGVRVAAQRRGRAHPWSATVDVLLGLHAGARAAVER